jgi:hypothetical protein
VIDTFGMRPMAPKAHTFEILDPIFADLIPVNITPTQSVQLCIYTWLGPRITVAVHNDDKGTVNDVKNSTRNGMRTSTEVIIYVTL